METEGLVIRCYDPTDADLLKDCVDSSLPELVARMPWAAAEPQTHAEKIELLRGMRSRFDADTEWVMGIFTPDESLQLGGTGLNPRDVEPGALQIGYFVRTDRAGQGIAGRAAGILTDVALRICGAERVQIMVEPDNTASLRIPRRLGYVDEGLLRARSPWPDSPNRDVVCFSVFPDLWDPDRAAAYRAFDATGTPIAAG